MGDSGLCLALDGSPWSSGGDAGGGQHLSVRNAHTVGSITFILSY